MIVEKILERIKEVEGQINRVNPDYKNSIHSIEYYSQGYRFVEREFILSLGCGLETKSLSFLEGMLDCLRREKEKLSSILKDN